MEDKREVPTSEALEYAKKMAINFLETSALDGSNCSKSMQIILQGNFAKEIFALIFSQIFTKCIFNLKQQSRILRKKKSE